MQLVQWIHKIAKANSIMYPGYKDKLYLTKLFLNTLILGNETMEYGKLFQIDTDGFQMSIKCPTSGGQARAQEAAVQQIFHLERSSFFYL